MNETLPLFIASAVFIVSAIINIGSARLLFKVHKMKESMNKELLETIRLRNIMLAERDAANEKVKMYKNTFKEKE